MLVARPYNSAGQPLKVTAVCSSSDAVGDLVHVASDRVGNDYVVSKTDMSAVGAKPAIGAIVAKLGSTRCVIQFAGEVRGVYVGLLPGKYCFNGLNSRPTHTPPAPTVGGRAYLQLVGVALADDVLYLSPEADMKVRIG